MDKEGEGEIGNISRHLILIVEEMVSYTLEIIKRISMRFQRLSEVDFVPFPVFATVRGGFLKISSRQLLL